jgi:hypothetical protein
MRLSRPVECVSDLVLDEWASGELDAATRERTERHIAGCPRCEARHAAFEQTRVEFGAAAPTFEAHARRFVPQRPARNAVAARTGLTRRRAWTAGGAAAVLAIAAAVVIAINPVEQTRLKGGPTIGYFVKRGERTQPGEVTTVVRAGDLLRFTYSSAQDRYFALFNRDGKSASIYYPEGAQGIRVKAGTNVALEFSVQLDDAPGPEEVHALFCGQSFELAPLRAALNDTGRLPVPAGCQHRVLVLPKEPGG